MKIIRAFIFNIFLFSWTIFFGIVSLPSLIIPGEAMLRFTSKIWAKGILLAADIICNIKGKIEGKVPAKGPFIVASKHQSALDIILFIACLDCPKFVLKKSLFWVPFIGMYAYKLGMIFVDRSAGMAAIKSMTRQVKASLEKNNIIIIFPEGTRVQPGIIGRYNSGIYSLYKLEAAPIYPVGLLTGKVWPKNSFLKHPGDFILKFTDKIENNLEKQEFMQNLQDKIEKASNL